MSIRGTSVDAFGCSDEAGGVKEHLIELKHQFANDW
jgi:hypothetical protein